MEPISQKLQTALQQVLSHDPWYGPSTYEIIGSVSFDAAYETPPGSVHNIAGILLHMLGWVHEVTARMQGKPAGEPAGGDWPDPGQPGEDKWKQLIADFKLANVTLAGIIQNFEAGKWTAPINDERNRELGTGVTYQALIEGLIQHHIYHTGQIALLNRIAGGL
ncbi:MAG: DinB family protein [Bacteroidota bacterium]